MRTHGWLRWIILPGLLVVFESALIFEIFVICSQQIQSHMPERAMVTAMVGVVFSCITGSLYKRRPRQH